MNSITAMVVIARPTKTKAAPPPTPPEPTPDWPETVNLFAVDAKMGATVYFEHNDAIPEGWIPIKTFKTSDPEQNPLVVNWELDETNGWLGSLATDVRLPANCTTVFGKLNQNSVSINGTMSLFKE